MGKEAHGDYAAYTTPGGIRFQHQGKLVSVNAVPPEVATLLTQKLTNTPRGEAAPAYKKPTPEELEAIRAEQLAPKPGLEADPAKLAEDAAKAQDRLTAEDFDEPPVPVDPSPPEEGADFIQEAGEIAQNMNSAGNTKEEQTVINHQNLAPKPIVPVQPDFLESVSIHSASLEDIAEALYNRFGIYTVYLNKLPEADEVNPLTAVQFTKYHLGIAYQAAIFAQNQGLLDLPPEHNRKQMDAGRFAAANTPLDKPVETMGEARRANSFEYRTSVKGTQGEPTTEIVHITDPETGVVKAVQRVIPAGEAGEFNGAAQRYDNEEDERIVEPRFGKQVIRPNW